MWILYFRHRPKAKLSKFSISKESSNSVKGSGIVISGKPRERSSAFRGSNSRLELSHGSSRESISNEEIVSLLSHHSGEKLVRRNEDLCVQTPRSELPSSLFPLQNKIFEEKE
jgi:hypothetical protein